MSAMAFWYYITLLFSGEENTYHVYQPVFDGMMRRRTVCLQCYYSVIKVYVKPHMHVRSDWVFYKARDVKLR